MNDLSKIQIYDWTCERRVDVGAILKIRSVRTIFANNYHVKMRYSYHVLFNHIEYSI